MNTFGVVAGLVGLVLATPAQATDLFYNMMSPNFGGTNGIALSMAQQEKSLKAANAQAKAALESSSSSTSTATSQNQAFINAVISQLTGLVAYKVAASIANSTNGQSGTITSGDTVITYINSSGQLSVTLTSPSGSTTITVPTGS